MEVTKAERATGEVISAVPSRLAFSQNGVEEVAVQLCGGLAWEVLSAAYFAAVLGHRLRVRDFAAARLRRHRPRVAARLRP